MIKRMIGPARVFGTGLGLPVLLWLLQVVADKKLRELRLREIEIGADVVRQLAEAASASDLVAVLGIADEVASIFLAVRSSQF